MNSEEVDDGGGTDWWVGERYIIEKNWGWVKKDN